jgi:hypothetical protein
MHLVKMEKITQWGPSSLFTFSKRVKVIKSGRLKWLGHVARIEKVRYENNTSVAEPGIKKNLERVWRA